MTNKKSVTALHVLALLGPLALVALVDPSIGSMTTTSPVVPGLKPLSSDNTPTPARLRIASAAASSIPR